MEEVGERHARNQWAKILQNHLEIAEKRHGISNRLGFRLRGNAKTKTRRTYP